MRFRVFTEPMQGASYEQLLTVARTAEECGFDAFFRSDHLRYMGEFLSTGDGTGMPGPTDAWTTLAGLARDTTAIRLGTLVTSATFRHPGMLAMQVAQVDAMSGGRVELGLGAGWDRKEHAAFGIPFPEKRERFDRLEEVWEILIGLWTNPVGETFSFHGTHYVLEGNAGLPKPAQDPHPPTIVGGAGKRRTPALAARFASEYNLTFGLPDVTPENVRDHYDRVRRACEEHGRDPATMRMSVVIVVACGTSKAEIDRRYEALGLEIEGLRTSCAKGTPDQVVERLALLRADGADTIYFSILDLDDLDHLRLLTDEVVSKFDR
ncbi:MAG: LLM class F420-dependent oxidoreductase [Actinomycetota bacterium]